MHAGWANRVFVLLFTAVAFPFILFGQSVLEKEQQFYAAVAAGNVAPAKALLRDLLNEDSLGIYRLIDPIESLFLPGDVRSMATPVRAELVTLLRVYTLGELHDPAGPAVWLRSKAMLALRYPAQFRDEYRPLLQAAIEADPFGCPLLLYQRWLAASVTRFKEAALPLEVVAQDWARASTLLYSREIRVTQEAVRTARTTQGIALQLRNAIPDCKKLVQVYGKAIRKETLSSASCADFLTLYALQDCNTASDLWQPAFDCAAQQAPQAWLYRLAATETQNAKDFRQSLSHWQTAANLETDPALQAADLLHQAQVQAMLGEFRAARHTIKQASLLHPRWGEPHLQLADLYLEGAATCNLSLFDQKAIYWLLIDLCYTAKNVDPGALQVANQRIYTYQQLMPSREEAAFKGLKEGDTWPLKCWMGTVTTVKMN